MERLPTELLEKIVSYCTKDGAMCARLVNRTLAAVSTPYVFEQMSMFCLPSSVDKIYGFSCSNYSKYVRQISVYTNRLEKMDKGEFREKMARLSNRWKEYVERYSVSWETYRSAQFLQEGLQDYLDQRKPLRDAFASFPALDTVNICYYDENAYKGTPSTASSASNRQTRSIMLWMSRRDFGMDEWAASAILDAMGGRAMAELRTPVRNLSIMTQLNSSILWPEILKLCADLSDYQGRVEGIMEAMRPLEHLTLDFTVDETAHIAWQSQLDKDVVSLVEGCRELRHLTIRYPRRNPEEEEPLEYNSPLSHLFGADPPTWPHLKTLEMSVNVRNSDMLAFMRTQGPTLDMLSIGGSGFDDVKEILNYIPQTLTNLKAIQLWNLWDWDEFANGDMPQACYFKCTEMNSPMDRLKESDRKWLLTGEGERPEWQPEYYTISFDE